jgi:hypothetical protein
MAILKFSKLRCSGINRKGNGNSNMASLSKLIESMTMNGNRIITPPASKNDMVTNLPSISAFLLDCNTAPVFVAVDIMDIHFNSG